MTTTGMLDWVHGELWVFPEGILRVPLGWGRTILQSTFQKLPIMGLPEFTMNAPETLAPGKKTLWLPFADMRDAALKRGIFAHTLTATLHDGTTRKLTWQRSLLAYDTVADALDRHLGANATIAGRKRVPAGEMPR